MSTPSRRQQLSPQPKRRNSVLFEGIRAEGSQTIKKKSLGQSNRKLSLPPIDKPSSVQNRYVQAVGLKVKNMSQEILSLVHSNAALNTKASSGAHLQSSRMRKNSNNSILSANRHDSSVLSPKNSKGKSPRRLKSLVSSIQTIKTTVVNPSVTKLSSQSKSTKRNDSRLMNPNTQSKGRLSPSGDTKMQEIIESGLLEQNPNLQHMSEYELTNYVRNAKDFNKIFNRSFVLDVASQKKYDIIANGFMSQYYHQKVDETVRPVGGPRKEVEVPKVDGDEPEYESLRHKTSLAVAEQQLKEIQMATQEQFALTNLNRLGASDAMMTSPRMLQPGFVPATTFLNNSPQKGMSYDTMMNAGQTNRPFIGMPGQTMSMNKQVLLDRIVFEQEGALLPMLNQSCMQSLDEAHRTKLKQYGQMSPRARRMAIAKNMQATPMGAKAFQLPAGAQSTFGTAFEEASTKMADSTFAKTNLVDQTIHEETLSELDSHGLFSESSQKGFDDTLNKIPIETIVTQGGFKDYDTAKKNIRIQVIRGYKEDEQNQIQLEAANNPEERSKRKRPKLKKKRSFAECQMKFEDGLGLREKYNFNRKGPNMINTYTLEEMTKAETFPIMEPLMHRPDNYKLHIDTVMHAAYHRGNIAEWAEYIDEPQAPQNSEEEFELVDIYYTTDEEKPQEQMGKKPDPMARFAKLDKRIFKLSIFDLDVFVDFPDKVKGNDTPLIVLKQKDPEKFEDTQKAIALDLFGVGNRDDYHLLTKGNRFWSMAYLQLLFEYFCLNFKAAAPSIDKFLTLKENGYWTLAFKNYTLNEPTLKAIACLIPFLVQVDEVHFSNNGMQDQVGSSLVFAVYSNPSIKNFICQGNFCKSAFMDSMKICSKYQPLKLQNINFLGSVSIPSNLEQCIRSLHINKRLTDLNLAGNSFGLKACGMLGTYIIHHGNPHLITLNLSRCNMSLQGTRYLVDALNRNTSIRFFNFSYNDMSSSIYEFSIKMGAIMTRHPNLMHLDITCTSLKREEVLFIGLALTMSKTMLSLHLTGNQLPYYDRIFMRSLMAARVGYNFKNDGQNPKIKNNKEFTQIMTLAKGNAYGQNIKDYVKHFNDLEVEREGLDFEIQDIIKEIDAEEEYKDLPTNFDLKDVKETSKLGRLIVKMKDRHTNLIQSKNTAKKAFRDKKFGEEMDKIQGIKALKDQADTDNPSAFWEKLGDNINATVAKTTTPNPEEPVDPVDDAFAKQQQLGVERQRQKAERELIKEEKNRSQGELALMFMGINQIANQLLNENPMTGYMAAIIFTRVLGDESLEQAHYWTDCNQCWICSSWNKFQVLYHPIDDKALFTKQVDNMEMISANVQRIVQNSLEEDGIYDELIDSDEELQQIAEASEDQSAELEISHIEEIEIEKMEDLNVSEGDVDGRTAGAATPEENKRKGTRRNLLEVDGDQKNAMLTQRMRELGVNTQDPIKVTSITRKELKQNQYPENYKKKTNFKKMDLSHTHVDPLSMRQSKHNKIISHNLINPPSNTLFPGLQGLGAAGRKRGVSRGSVKSDRGFDKDSDFDEKVLEDLADPVKDKPENHSSSDALTVNTSAVKVRRRVRGQPTMIEREVFFKGMVFLVEEVIYSDSDKSSIYTSEDDFETSKTIGKDFAGRFPLLNEKHPAGGQGSSGDEGSQTTIQGDQNKTQQSWPSYIETNRKTEKERIEKAKKIDLKPRRDQKEYQSKLLPKQYMESLKDQRITKFEQHEIDEAQNVLAKRQKRARKRLERKYAEAVEKDDPDAMKKVEELIAILEKQQGDQEEAKVEDVFLISSAYDWLPMKMKTKRRLTLEKIDMATTAPPTILNVDNTTLMYGNYVAPGYHYFYFVQGTERVFLNPRYPIFRFKSTNVFLNRVNIRPKVHQFESVFTLKEGVEDDELFLIDVSVFAKYEPEQLPQRMTLLKKCFEQDCKYAKFDRVCKSDETLIRECKKVLWENHYAKLYNIWLFGIRRDEIPTITLGDFTSWAKAMDLIDEYQGKLDQATFDRTFISVNVNTHGLINSAQRDLNRYEFLEIIVRFALLKYRDAKDQICKTATEAINKLMNEKIYPNAETLDGWQFRQRCLYNVKVNEFLRKNLEAIEKIYKTPNGIISFHSKKKWITVQEARLYLNACGIAGGSKGISEWQVGACFYESLRVLEDTIKVPRMCEMQPWEFIVFICSITHAYFKIQSNGVYHGEAMHIKLEKILPMWLEPVFGKMEFTTDSRFEYDIKQEKKKARAARRAAGISDDEDEDDDDSEEEEEEEEVAPTKVDGEKLSGNEDLQSPRIQQEIISEEHSEQEEDDKGQNSNSNSNSNSDDSSDKEGDGEAAEGKGDSTGKNSMKEKFMKGVQKRLDKAAASKEDPTPKSSQASPKSKKK